MPRLVLQSAILSRGTLTGCVRCLLSRWAPHHLRILRSHHSNLGCQDWCCSRQSSQGAHWLGVVRCLLSRWAPHHLRILRSHHSNLGCQTGAAVGNPLKGHTDGASVAYSPDGRHIISGSDDRTIRIWDASRGWYCSRQASRGAYPRVRSSLLLTLRMGSTSFLGLVTTLPCVGRISICFHPTFLL
jgi:WD40 repeat protein